MISGGGLEEIKEILLDTQNNYKKGVLQSIGYKEFEPFLQNNDQNTLEKCINSLVLSTLQYSKKQIRWIKNRMQQYLYINIINTNNSSDWDSIKAAGIDALNHDVEISEVVFPKIVVKDCDICGVKLKGKTEWEQHMKSRKHKKNLDQDYSDDEENRNCELCQKSVKGKIHWMSHIKSRKHLRKVKSERQTDN